MGCEDAQTQAAPTGIRTFRLIREEDCYYVDKTPFAQALVKQDGVRGAQIRQ